MAQHNKTAVKALKIQLLDRPIIYEKLSGMSGVGSV